MTAAIFGLVGVAIGGLISGGATYLMARREERQRARAAARLLQDDLESIERLLRGYLDAREFRERAESAAFADVAFARSRDTFVESLSLALWLENRPILAETLGSSWHKVSEAYAWVSEARRLAVKSEKYEEELHFPIGFLDAGRERLWAGLEALSRLAD